MSVSDETLVRLLTAVEGLRQALTNLPTAIAEAIETRHRPAINRSADERLEALLHAIESTAGAECEFTTAELIVHAYLPMSGPLRAALEGVAGSPPSGRRLGWALRRGLGSDFHGLRIECLGELRNGNLWAVRRCPGFAVHNPETRLHR